MRSSHGIASSTSPTCDPITLKAFVSGDAKLTPEILAKLTDRIWNDHLKYDPVTDQMQSANTRTPTTVNTCIAPRGCAGRHHVLPADRYGWSATEAVRHRGEAAMAAG